MKVSEEADDPLDWGGHSRQGLASCGKDYVNFVCGVFGMDLDEGLQGYGEPLQARGQWWCSVDGRMKTGDFRA